jgi:hypothetical protein
MKENEPNPSSDDLLDRAIHVFKTQNMPVGPTDEAHGQTMAALRQAERDYAEKRSFFWRAWTIPAIKFAAAIGVVVGGLSIWLLVALFGATPSVSYAEVAQEIRAARTLTYTVTTDVEGISMVMKQLVRGSVIRTEMPMGQVIISETDGANMKSLTLDNLSQTARVMNFKRDGANTPALQANPANAAEGFRALADQQGEPIADREINGIKAKGFQTKGMFPASIWVDPVTKLPLRVEYHVTVAGKPASIVMSGFVFDPPLDESQFSLVPPAGYKVIVANTTTIHMDVETNVITLLKGYAGLKDGQFPKRLDDWGDLAMQISKMSGANFTPEEMDTMSSAGALMPLLNAQQKGKDYDYTPGDAKLGDAGKIVFWWQKDGAYHAIYGDLHSGEVTRDQLPKPN